MAPHLQSGSLLGPRPTLLDRAAFIPWVMLLVGGWAGLWLWLSLEEARLILGAGWLGCWAAVLVTFSPLLMPGGTRRTSWLRVHHGWESARAVLEQLPEEGSHAHVVQLARRHTEGQRRDHHAA